MSSHRLSDCYCVRAPLRSLYLSVGALLAGIVIVVVIQMTYPDTAPAFWQADLISIPVVVALGVVFAGRRYFRSRHVLRSFQVILERDELTRTAIGLPDVTLFQDEVTDLVQVGRVGVMVHTANPRRFIFVPAVLVGYEDLRGRLAGWHEIKVRPSRARSYWLTVIGGLTLFGGVYAVELIAQSAYVVVPAAAVLFSLVSWCIWVVLRSPYLDARAKRVCWVAYCPLIPAVLKLALLFGFLGSQ